MCGENNDMFNCIDLKRAISPQNDGGDTPLVSEIIDLQGNSCLTFAIATGSLADAGATFTALVEEGDAANLSDAAAVADGDLLGTEALASFTQASDNKCFKIGYKGIKRYVRLTITPSGNAGDAYISALAILCPQLQPAANPPA